MLPFANPLLINAHALPVDNSEPHAQVGNHLRVNTHPLLGLPVAPFIVERAEMKELKRLTTRRDAIFYDRSGQILTPPFDVRPDNPVIARLLLAPGEVCIWAQVEAVSQKDLAGVGTTRPGMVIQPNDNRRFSPITPLSSGITDAIRRRGSIVASDRLRRGIDLDLLRRPNVIEAHAVPGLTPDFLLKPTDTLTCEAFINSAMGPAPIGRRSSPRYAFSGPGIVQIRIFGSGRVGGIRWIEAKDPQHIKYRPYAILNLPHPGGSRYLPIHNAINIARERVRQQAPKRRPLQETVNTPAPSAAPLANISFEQNRVSSLTTTLDNDLDSLINDLSEVPLEQHIQEIIRDENGNNIGQSSMARLHSVYQAMADPGTASLIGYKLRDKDWREVEDRLVFYRVNAYFRDFPSDRGDILNFGTEALIDAMIGAVPPDNRNWTRDRLVEHISSAAQGQIGFELNDGLIRQFEIQDDYFGIGSVAIADRGAPLDQIEPPRLTSARHKDWIPAVPPAAIREVRVNVADVRIAGLLASGKRTPASSSGAYAPLNKKNPGGFHLPLILSLNTNEEGDLISEPGTGFISDRKAAASGILYFASQQDRFGRWSNWASRAAAPGPRPKPPRPDFQAFYTQPAIADAATEGGKIRVKVSVPDAEALAPGSHLLQKLRLTVSEDAGPFSMSIEVLENTKITFPGDPNTFFLLIPFDGPILQPTELRKLRLVAHWVDTTNQDSDASEPQTVKMHDPRPPAQLPVPDQLQYSARPDVTGLSWVEHRWTAGSGQANFGIYYTDENRLLSHLASENEDAILADIDSAANAAARATLFKANTDKFPDHLFERLRNVEAEFNSGEKGFRHAVSGSLRILNFYKIAAESATGARPILLDLPMIVYGVPNSDPPARPTLEVKPVVPDDDEPDYVAEVTMSLVVGTTLGETWRLRRSSVSASNIHKMPIVTTGPLGVVDSDKGVQSAEYRDIGNVQISDTARLKPWIRYSWVAEIQGAPESGSAAAGQAVPGRWSRASDPVDLVLIPANPPAAPIIDAVNRDLIVGGFNNVVINYSHPDDLSGGAIGAFKLRLSRKIGPKLSVLSEINLDGEGPFTISGMDDPGEVLTSDTEYRLEIIDPIKRVSPAAIGTLS